MDAHRDAPPAGQQIVHVRGDSQRELEALFSAVINPSKAARQPSSLPMRMRKLPDSFFRQPDPRGHSRQASSDGGVCGSLTPHHVRAHSSPASLPVNSLSTQAADVAAAPIIPDDMPLPHGWEMAKTPTGQRYFLNHLEKTTTWHDPRLAQLQSAATQHPISGTPIHAHSLSNPAPTTQAQSINPETGPLPEGWEQAVTADGEVYYIDHINKTTTWVDPRLAQKMNPGLLGLAMQQRQEKERLRCKQGLPPQEAGGRSQMPGGMDHDRSSQTLVPPLDVRIRAPSYEPTLNGAHSRNESTDSGLSVSSLPRTSDHMLSSVDQMDTGEGSDPPSMALQESMPVLPMSEGEELMPCIPEGLSSDLLMDMETVFSGSHMDKDSLLTWL
ncbi:transcriptional coactivator YAP1-like isoform X1 [Salarias fasciatus]|uniref:transcriptional coactivator YAP1-like isoform X1 n=1 Tax=Salarias fasciatus TaxID=181472 RepID=UPI001176B196|nr:transcriptional coactivator YAP1-like isoform X1 [Salarias fasciatus]